MILRRKYTASIFLFLLAVFSIVAVNQWVARQVKHLTTPPPAQIQPRAAQLPAEAETAVRRRPVIDPHNDPLAPVSAKVSSASSSPPPRKMKPKKVYEGRVEEPILVQ